MRAENAWRQPDSRPARGRAREPAAGRPGRNRPRVPTARRGWPPAPGRDRRSDGVRPRKRKTVFDQMNEPNSDRIFCRILLVGFCPFLPRSGRKKSPHCRALIVAVRRQRPVCLKRKTNGRCFRLPHRPVPAIFPGMVCALDTPAFASSRTARPRLCPRPGKCAPPLEKPRLGFFSAPRFPRPDFSSQPVEPHREKRPAPTTTASGVHFYGLRYYKPELGRWINRDPIEERGGLNLYVFIQNRGMNAIDLFGLSCILLSGPDLVEGAQWKLARVRMLDVYAGAYAASIEGVRSRMEN